MTVIIPTLALAERAGSLRRAIDSVVAQHGVRAVPLVVLNGTRRDREVERAVRVDRRVRIISRAEAHLPGALQAGRAAVDTPWFAALDDDDLLLPGALSLRVRELQHRRGCSVVVTNGYKRNGAGDELNIPSGSDVNADPLRALLRRNWLLPGSWLMRSDADGPDLFAGMPRYLECTYLAVRFATEHRMVWLDAPTVVYCVGSPLAMTRSREFVVGQADALRRILALELPPDVRRELHARIASAYHCAANHARDAGALEEAWRWHAASLRSRGGWRYLPFMRHLIRDGWRRRS